MPFMKGEAPIRRTIQYLKKGNIIFRPSVKIFSINYNREGDHHEGIRNFVFWFLPQIQYQNPSVQCITFKDLTPSPFIKIFFDTGNSLLIDVDSRNRLEISNHIRDLPAVCQSRDEINEKSSSKRGSSIMPYFGFECHRHCICEVLGQVPCSSIVSVPKLWRGIHNKKKEYFIPPKYTEPGLEKISEEE